MNQGNGIRGYGTLVNDQFEGTAYKIEDNVGRWPIRGRELIEAIRYFNFSKKKKKTQLKKLLLLPYLSCLDGSMGWSCLDGSMGWSCLDGSMGWSCLDRSRV